MRTQFCAALVAAILAALAVSAATLAQERDPADEAKAWLTAQGYTVTEVDYAVDDRGQTRRDAVYVLMEAVQGNLDDAELAAQVLWGVAALRQYYPRATTLDTLLAYRQYWFMFASSSTAFDQYQSRATDANAYWAGLRAKVRIYDRIKRTFTDDKNFANSQTGKDQAGKDLGKNPKPPVPTPVPVNVKGGALWLEPSTTYLPADDGTRVVMMATLLDDNLTPQTRRGITFASQAPGQDEQPAGYKSTDANGRAFAAIQGTSGTPSLLLRASTDVLNSQVSIVVGPAVVRKNEQIKAVEKGLTDQGYADVEVEYSTSTRATGEVDNTGYVQMRMASTAFDRTVFAQISRAFGTVRTIFPNVNRLLVALIYRKQGQDWQLLWQAQTAHWDQLVAGRISESEFWRYLQYLGAYDEDGHRVDDKNFVDKDFGAGTGRKEALIPRSLVSTVTGEEWGEQWHGQEFIVLPGSYADAFTLVEWSGNATALQIFRSPDLVTPVVTYERAVSAATLQAVRLGQGQYLFAVVAPSAPATVRVTYIEHLPR